jgi:hypothetical protein
MPDAPPVTSADSPANSAPAAPSGPLMAGSSPHHSWDVFLDQPSLTVHTLYPKAGKSLENLR